MTCNKDHETSEILINDKERPKTNKGKPIDLLTFVIKSTVKTTAMSKTELVYNVH